MIKGFEHKAKSLPFVGQRLDGGDGQPPCHAGDVGARGLAQLERLFDADRLEVGPRLRQGLVPHLGARFPAIGPGHRVVNTRQHQDHDRKSDDDLDQRETSLIP